MKQILSSDSHDLPTDSEQMLQLTDDIRITTNTPGDDRHKRFLGYVVARPHEYLIHIRKGRILEKSSGQAARCFKWPGDTVILVPTSLKQLIFEAGQLTHDNVAVRVRGFATYRIAHPLEAYQRISFWDRYSAERKLALIIGEPCRSHIKWLIANMTMEDCLRKRKESIADALLKELRLTITTKSQGVEIETVDIQDIRIEDQELYQALQAPTKQDILRREQLSKIAMEREIASEQFNMDQESAERKKFTDIVRVRDKAEVEREERARSRVNLLELNEMEKMKSEGMEVLESMRNDADLLRQERAMEAQHAREIVRLKSVREERELELELLKSRIEIENHLGPKALEKMFLEKSLPDIAAAICATMANARISIYTGGDNGVPGLPYKLIMDEVLSILHTRLENYTTSPSTDV